MISTMMRRVGNGPGEFSFSTHLLQIFCFFYISVVTYSCIVQYRGLTKYESNQNISPYQEVGLESININYVAFFVLNIGCSPVLGHTVCHLILGATVMQKLPVPSQ